MNIALNINRQMVNLFFEIKRNMPSNTQDDIRITSTGIGHLLLKLHRESESNNLRQLIEKFMAHAGGEWTEKLEASKSINATFRHKISTFENIHYNRIDFIKTPHTQT